MASAGSSARCRVQTFQQRSRVLDCVKRASVLVPPGFGGVGVLYLLHGYGATRETWLQRTRLVEHAAQSGLLIVLPESGRRWFINDHRGLRYEDYLLGELLPAVEARFLDQAGSGSRAIGGFSMGGAAALMQALRHPDLFSVALSHAGAFEAPLRDGDPYADQRADRNLAMPTVIAHERVWGPLGSEVRQHYELHNLLAQLPAGPRPVVHADVGTADYPRVLEMNRRAVATLRAAGIDTVFHERPGTHDLAYLDANLPNSLRFAAAAIATADSSQTDRFEVSR